ncbi:MAG: patatin-like phospholipase family protein [Nocardioidaceae bacterium]
MYRVLAVDGGGVRGVVPAVVLAELEARSGRPVADLFDLVAATSTGAILGLGLTCPGPDGRPAVTAQQLVDRYRDDSRTIFSRSPWWRLRTANGFLGPKYDVSRLESRLQQALGTVPLSQALCEVLVTAYDLHARSPYFFTRSSVRDGTAPDVPMWLVARCSSAAPTYFAAGRAPSRDGTRFLVDGGVMANNPALCAYAEVIGAMDARVMVRDDLVLVSLGTGSATASLAAARIRAGGTAVWARPLFEVVLDGQEDVVDHQLRDLMPPRRYYRFQADLPDPSEAIDVATPEVLHALSDTARRLVEARSGELSQLATLLATGRG